MGIHREGHARAWGFSGSATKNVGVSWSVVLVGMNVWSARDGRMCLVVFSSPVGLAGVSELRVFSAERDGLCLSVGLFA
jgi:hypothetical protein